MANTRELKVVIVGDASGAQKAMKQAEGSFASFGAVGLKADAVLGGVQSKLGLLGPVGKTASSAFGDITAKLGALGPVQLAAGAGAIALGGALVAGAKAGIASYVELTAQGRTLQRVTGASAEETSKLAYDMRALGVDTDAGAKAFFNLSKSIENTPHKLASVGVEVAKNKDGSVNLTETLLRVSDAYNATSNAAAKNDIAFQAFGKAGQALIPILARGRIGLEELNKEAAKHGAVFSQSDYDGAKRYSLAMRNLGEAVSGLERSLGQGLVPALTTVAKDGAGLVDFANKASSSVGGLGGVIGGVFKGGVKEGIAILNPFNEAMTANALLHGHFREALVDDIPILGGWIGKNKDGEKAAYSIADAEKAAASSLKDAAAAAEADAKALDALENAQVSLVDSTLGVLGAEDSLRRSEQDLTDKQTALATAVREHGAASKEAQRAALDYGDAQHSLEQQASATAHAIAAEKEQTALAAGQTFDAGQKADAYKQALLEVAAGIGGPVGAALIDLAKKVNDIETNKKIVVGVVDNATPTLDAIRAKMNAYGFANVNGKIYYGGPGAPDPSAAPPHRARGGPVKAGFAYQVNEDGTETFVPGMDGTILPHGARAAGGGSAVSLVTVNLTGPTITGFVGNEAALKTMLDQWAKDSADHIARQVTPPVMAAMRLNMKRNGDSTFRASR